MKFKSARFKKDQRVRIPKDLGNREMTCGYGVVSKMLDWADREVTVESVKFTRGGFVCKFKEVGFGWPEDWLEAGPTIPLLTEEDFRL